MSFLGQGGTIRGKPHAISLPQSGGNRAEVYGHEFLSFHMDFDVIGLIHLNWGHSSNQLPKVSESWRRSVTKSYSKNAVVEKTYALRYVCGQVRFCRVSGLAQQITPAMLNLRAKDRDMHRERLKVAMTMWAAHAGGQTLTPFLATVLLVVPMSHHEIVIMMTWCGVGQSGAKHKNMPIKGRTPLSRSMSLSRVCSKCHVLVLSVSQSQGCQAQALLDLS